jgi:hypothetical protein
VNPPKDVDAYYEVGSTRVSMEIKCAVERLPSPESYVVKTAGRLPDRLQTVEKLQSLFEGSRSGNRLELAKNKDNTMKDFLVNANKKFAPKPTYNQLNVLLIACGNEGNIQDWWHYLYGGEGLFTNDSFHPPEEFALVDVLILSNLKYLHSEAYQYHNWTLQNAFLLPFVNRHRRQSLVSESIYNGLSVFDHHLSRFAKFTPKWNKNDPSTPDADVLEQVRLFITSWRNWRNQKGFAISR